MVHRLVTVSVFAAFLSSGAPAFAQSAAPAAPAANPAPAGAAPAQAPVAAAPPAPAPLLIPPALPDPASLVSLPAADLARGYLAAKTALPLARQAAAGQGTLGLGIDGVAYSVSAANAAPFITFLQAREDAFTQAITKRGSVMIDGQYTLAAGPGCTGEKFDPRYLFSPGKAPDGSILPAKAVQIITNGIETDMLVTLVQNRDTIGSVLSGTAVDNTVIFADVLSMGYSVYGTIGPNTIALRFDPDEVENALGPDAGTAADWKRLSACVFTLTKK
jgi:hypothetical protein